MKKNYKANLSLYDRRYDLLTYANVYTYMYMFL